MSYERKINAIFRGNNKPKHTPEKNTKNFQHGISGYISHASTVQSGKSIEPTQRHHEFTHLLS